MIEQFLKEENIVLNFRETEHEKKHIVTGQYAHILKIDDKNLILYYQVLSSPESICCAISEDGGLTFNKPENNYVLKKSLACNNFRAFIDHNPNSKTIFKAVGGHHCGNNFPSHKDCNCKNYPTKECVDPVWPNKKRNLFIDDIYHPCQGNGYYIWESDNGLNWRVLSEKPILSSFTKIKDFNKLGHISPDGGPSIFYDNNINEYVVYLRTNIKLGVRHVSYSRSPDLVKWSEPELIKLNPGFNFEHDNLYYGGIYKYIGEKNKYIGFPSYFKNIIHDPCGEPRSYYDECTLVMISNDGLNWTVKDKWFEGITTNPQWRGHMRAPHVLGFIESPNKKEFWLYIQKDFLTDHNKLYRYSIKKEEFNKIFN